MATANTLGPQLRRADQVWTGPTQTAQALGLQAVERSELANLNRDSWSGKTLARISGQQPENIAAWLTDPATAPHGGESIAGLSACTAALMDALLAERGHTIAVTHPAVWPRRSNRSGASIASH